MRQRKRVEPDPTERPFALGWALLAVILLGLAISDYGEALEPAKVVVAILGGSAAFMCGRDFGMPTGYLIGRRKAEEERKGKRARDD